MGRQEDRSKVLIVLGATATGKSQLGIKLAKQWNGEILSADSMQVYRGMDIGTAKLTQAEMEDIPHHLLNIVNPHERFTVADWVRLADSVIQDVIKRGKLPIVVGGTGLYIRGITEDMDFSVDPGSTEIREKWERYLEENGPERLHAELAVVDDIAAARIHPNDTRRVIRAIEVFKRTGVPFSQSYQWDSSGGRYDTLQIGLSWPRDVLYARVEERIDQMLTSGLVKEVERLLAQGVSRQDVAMQAIGYKEIAAYLAGEVSYDYAIEQVKQATRRYVKRQASWFARYPDIHWFHTLLSAGRMSYLPASDKDDVPNLNERIADFLRQEL